jgi:hypothetical protein
MKKRDLKRRTRKKKKAGTHLVVHLPTSGTPSVSGTMICGARPHFAAAEDRAQFHETTLANLRQVISRTYFANDGDSNEQRYWPTFKERFPNLELFWRQFIVPTSRRIELPPSDPKRIGRREHVDDALWGMTYLHYSVFLHLSYAHEHLNLPVVSSFGDFYTHLVSASDLAQEFLLKTYSVILECRGASSQFMQGLTRDEFLKHAGEWYDTKYGKIYEHYLAKGKWSSITLPSRPSVVAEYMEHAPSWDDYQRFDQSVRQYRNILVHREVVGEVIVNPGISLVPRREKIQEYLLLKEVFQAANDPERLMTDFIPRQEQMLKDFLDIQIRLNALWAKPIADLESLFFQERNKKLCERYSIRFQS